MSIHRPSHRWEDVAMGIMLLAVRLPGQITPDQSPTKKTVIQWQPQYSFSKNEFQLIGFCVDIRVYERD